jgi:hypothetical protein
VTSRMGRSRTVTAPGRSRASSARAGHEESGGWLRSSRATRQRTTRTRDPPSSRRCAPAGRPRRSGT